MRGVRVIMLAAILFFLFVLTGFKHHFRDFGLLGVFCFLFVCLKQTSKMNHPVWKCRDRVLCLEQERKTRTLAPRAFVCVCVCGGGGVKIHVNQGATG